MRRKKLRKLSTFIACAATLVTLAPNVLAQTQTQTLEQEIMQSLRKIRKITRNIEGRLPSMKPKRMEKVAAKLQDAILALRPGSGGGHTGPQITVTGSIENKPFNFLASDASHLAVLCTEAYAGMGNADEMKVSVNFQPEVSKKTGGWWKGAGEVCGQLASAALAQGLPAFTGPGYSLVGTIENKTFVLEAPNLGELNQQCIDFYESTLGGNSDELVYFNGLEVITEKTGGWWRSSTETCNVIMAKVSQLK